MYTMHTRLDHHNMANVECYKGSATVGTTASGQQRRNSAKLSSKRSKRRTHIGARSPHRDRHT